MEKKKKALYTKKSISYGLVNGISSLKTNMTGTYLSFFLTTFVGLTNVQLGTMNTVKGLIGLWGSFVIGVIMQKVRLPWGRYRSWIYIMMPLAGIFQILTFVNWGNLPEGIKFPLVFVICVLDTFLYNFAFAAYTGLMIPLAPDPTERTGLAGARSQINSIGKVFFGFVAVAAIAFIGKLFNNEAAGYTGFMVLIVIALTASFFNLAKIAKSVDPSTGKSDPAAKDGTAVETAKESKKDGVSFWTMIKSVCNKQTIAWLIVSFSHGIPYALVMSLVAYYYGFVIGDKTMMATYMALSTLMQFVGSFIGPIIAKRLGIKGGMYSGLIIYAVALGSAYFIGKNPLIFTILLCVAMIGRNVCYTIELPLYTNVIDYTAIVNGKDVRPFMSSLYTVTIGIAKTIAGALLGFGLATVGFDKAAVTTEAVQGIRVLLSAVPCASLAIGMIALSMFNVTEEKLIALRKEKGLTVD